MNRPLSTRQVVFDAVLAGACFVLRVAVGVEGPAQVVVIALMAAALGVRRAHPPAALGLAWGGALITMLTLQVPDIACLAVIPVLFATSAYGSPSLSRAGMVSAVVGAALAALYLVVVSFGDAQWDDPQWRFGAIAAQAVGFAVAFASLLAIFGLSWALGLLRRASEARREERAARLVAEQEEERARREVAMEQERTRLARDMHDVVAHSLAVVIAQADGARYAARTDPAIAEESLQTIAETARSALGDVRMLLARLRHSQGDTPQPMLRDLPGLVEQMRGTGLDVRLSESGVPPEVPTGIQMAIYRVVQESLTNALRHGDVHTPVSLTLEWPTGVGEDVHVVVRNRLPAVDEIGRDAGTHARSGGHGIAGMQERAVLVGGAVTAGRSGRDFVVDLRLPLPSTEQTGVSE